MNPLEHRKIKESSLHIELLDTNYYKEILLNVFNNQLMVVSFICDDALDYNAENMHDTYAPSKYTEAIIKREDYFAKKFKDNHIALQNVFHLVILNGIGRAVSCSLKNVFSDYGIVHLNPFELHQQPLVASSLTFVVFPIRQPLLSELSFESHLKFRHA